ncbi:hypothetical protein KQI84_14055 [bacterium]|nr:hypothetical protein [bacterium]
MKSALPSLRWAAGGILVAGMMSRITGLLREMILAHSFGVGADLDAVYLGLSVPIALTVGIGGGLAAAAVPVAAGVKLPRLRGMMNVGTRRLFEILAPLSLLLAVTSPFWTRLLVLEGDTRRSMMIWAAVIGSLTMAGGAISGLYSGLVNAHGRHVTAAVKPAFHNIVVIAVLLLFSKMSGALALAFGLLAAEWLQILVLAPVLHFLTRRVKPLRRLEDWDGLKALFWPAAIIGIIAGLNITVDRMFATMLQDGAIAALSYAEKLVNLPAGLLGLALSAPLFTRLSRFRAANQGAAFQETLLLGIRLTILAGAPAAVLLVGLAEPAVGLLFERGAFDLAAVGMSSVALRGYCLALPFLAMMPLLAGAGLAARRPWMLVAILVVMVGLNAWLDWILVRSAGLFGIAAATSIILTLKSTLMVLVVAPKILRARSLWRTVACSLLYAAVVGGLLFLFRLLTGFLPSSSMGVRIFLLGGGLAIAAVATGLLWRPLIAAEWLSLERHRHKVAEYARRLAPANAESIAE